MVFEIYPFSYGSESFSKGNDNANKVIKIQNPFDVKPNKLVFEMMEYHSIHQQVVLKMGVVFIYCCIN